MAGFTVDGVEYELLSFDNLDDFTLGDLRVLEEDGGLSLSALTAGEIQITARLVIALILLSMRRVNPAAVMSDAERVPMTVLEQLMAASASPAAVEEAGDALPPSTAAEAAGTQP